jgi:hypothetical protein
MRSTGNREMEPTIIDRKKLVGVIAEKLNILVSEDDPIFATVILNELVLSEFVDIVRMNLDDLVFHIDRLKTSIPFESENAIVKMKGQAENIIAATRHLDQRVNAITEQINAYVLATTRNAVEAAKLDLQESMTDSAKTVANEILEPFLKKTVEDIAATHKQLIDRSGDLEKRIEKTTAFAVSQLNGASENMQSQWNRFGLYCAVAGFTGGFIFFASQTLAHLLARLFMA